MSTAPTRNLSRNEVYDLLTKNRSLKTVPISPEIRTSIIEAVSDLFQKNISFVSGNLAKQIRIVVSLKISTIHNMALEDKLSAGAMLSQIISSCILQKTLDS